MRSDNMPRSFAPEHSEPQLSDIVARLRNEASDGDHLGVNEQTITTAFMREGADEIERLRVERDRLCDRIEKALAVSASNCEVIALAGGNHYNAMVALFGPPACDLGGSVEHEMLERMAREIHAAVSRDDHLADTQRAIIEAAERRGYARAKAESDADKRDAAEMWRQAGYELCVLTECVSPDDAKPRKSLDAVISYFQELDRDPLANADRRDAERYRWLRDPHRIPDSGDADEHIVVADYGGDDLLWDASLDRAIDAAIAAQREAK